MFMTSIIFNVIDKPEGYNNSPRSVLMIGLSSVCDIMAWITMIIYVLDWYYYVGILIMSTMAAPMYIVHKLIKSYQT